MADTSMRIDLAMAGATPASDRPDAGVSAAARPALERRWLHGPWADFLLLGGGSFIVLAAMAAFFPRDEASRVALAGAMLFLAHFVNHPHFAHSYQIFYRDFARKAFPPSRRSDFPQAEDKPLSPPGEGFGVRAEQSSPSEPIPEPLAARYRFAGILVPAVLATFFAAALAEGSVALLGLAANIMFFTVGWHYAKQGYGILMLDAARKGIRFGPAERRRLLWNTHLAWVVNWLVANDALAAEELWGITYYLIDVPDALLVAMVAAVAVSTLAVGRDLFATWRVERVLPLNGLLAYVAAVYVWLAVSRIDPVLLLVVPFFHSLQYLAVVWAYQLDVEVNRRRAEVEHVESEVRWKAWLRSAPVGLARFFVAGAILGFAGFFAAPVALDTFSGYDRAVFGAMLFLFIGWTFINIHHYFIDNVIWRRDNPEARRYLFGGGSR